MLHRNAAQKRLGKQPSASQAFQQQPRTQIPAHGGTPCQLSQRQPGATTATEGSAGAQSTTCTSLIPGGPPSPSPWDPTTHGARPTLQQAAPATTGEAPPERRAQHARYYCPETGHKHAGSNRLQLEGESTPAAVSARGILPPTKPITQGKLRTPPRPGPARDLPFGAGHEKAKPVMDHIPTCTSLIPGGPLSPSPWSSTTHHVMPIPQPAAPTTIEEAQQERRAQQAPHHSTKEGNEQAGSSSLQLGGRSTPAATKAPAVRYTLHPTTAIPLSQLGTPHRPARDLPFGAEHEQANHVMDQTPTTYKQKNSDVRKILQKKTLQKVLDLTKIGRV